MEGTDLNGLWGSIYFFYISLDLCLHLLFTSFNHFELNGPFTNVNVSSSDPKSSEIATLPVMLSGENAA